MTSVFEFFSKIADNVTSILTNNSYSDLITFGTDAVSKIFGIAKGKYNENWIIKVLIIDNRPIDEAVLFNIISIIY